MNPTAKLYYCLHIIITAATTFLITHTAGCPPLERDALLAFKKGITSDPANLLNSWQEDQEDCCRWRGVSCSNRTAGHVVKLRLRSTLPAFSGMVGQISPSLLSLEHLEHLDLSVNSLEGPTGRLPEFLGSLKSLRYLNLSCIPFSGIVPPQLGNLSNLQYLDLSNMRLMYSTDISWLTHLPLLQYLSMESINLNTVIDWPRVVNMIPSLRVIDLCSCALVSANQPLPHLNLTKLEKLDVRWNYFDHRIESCWFWNLTSLVYLELGGNQLYGQFPSALGDMTALQVLGFSGNVNKTTMTANLTKLCNLEILGLSYSPLHGNITELLERLPQCSLNKLRELYLKNSYMNGILPARIGHLTSLIILDLGSNNLTGPMPAWIGNLTSLITLDLAGSNLTGPIPAWIGNLSNLITLNLYANHLTGPVPSEISMLTNLTTLDLCVNNLNGVITEKHFAFLMRLKIVNLSRNFLKIVVDPEWVPPFRLEEAYFASCQMGPRFPTWLQWQVDILRLDISNTSIADRLPEWFCTTFSKTIFMIISNNQISHKLPTNMQDISLETLNIHSNQLIGQIPPLPRNLTYLDISKNSLSGPLPSNFGAPKLDTLILYSNYFTGHIPESICELQNMYALDLSNNSLQGELPPCFGMTRMAFLLLSNNNFSGKFPPFLRSCESLAFLDLAWNKFSGRLPMWIGELVKLQFLRLNHNEFYGDIPINITNLRYLYHLNLAGNSISGVIPWGLSKLTSMTRKYVVNIYDIPIGFTFMVGELSVITKGEELNFHGVQILYMVSLDLSFNYLTGEIPEEITSLNGLSNLNLSWNHLSGKVTNKIGAMESLESLDLSKNMLSGEIPPNLSNLTYLSYMDLSYNNFTGKIPSGRQLDTLYTENPSMYNGNNGLCGPPLQKNCSRNDTPKHDYLRTNEWDSKGIFFYYGLGLGFILGFWLVFCALLFKKVWRTVYFHLVDKLYDKLYVFVVVNWASLTRKTIIN